MPGLFLVECSGSVSPRGSGTEEQTSPKRKDPSLFCPSSGAIQSWGRKGIKAKTQTLLHYECPWPPPLTPKS